MNQQLSLQDLMDQAVAKRDTSIRQLATLAQDAGFKITYTTLHQIRNGTYKSVPGEVTVRAVAWLAGVEPSVAFTAAGQPVPGPPFAEELPPGVDHLSLKSRKVAIDMLRVLVDLETNAHASNNEDQEQSAHDGGAGAQPRNARPGQKTRRLMSVKHPDEDENGNIPLPDDYLTSTAAYDGPTSHHDREREWAQIGEETQDGPEAD